MKIKLTIDIFSGRPNPVLELEGAEAKKVLDQIDLKTKFRNNTEKTVPAPFGLGYRGVLVEQLDAASESLPKSFRIAHDFAYADSKNATANDNSFEKVILDRFSSFKAIPDKKDFKKYLEAQISAYRLERLEFLKKWPFEIGWPPFNNPCKCAPDPDLNVWNQSGRVSLNNCYNYSTNYWTNTFAQPGNSANQQYTSLSGCSVASGQRSAKDGAVADGLIDTPTANNKCPGKGHLVALVVAPNYDYHWYRKGPNGRWSHKPGGTPATLLDNLGNAITDPRTANRGPYTEFCTFMQVIHGHFKVS
jgi:hypothetical protein